jgi:hypothetical protein
VQLYIQANIRTINTLQIVLHTYTHRIFGRVKRQAAIVAGNFTNGDPRLIGYTHDHFIARFIHRKAKHIKAANHIGYSGRCKNPDAVPVASESPLYLRRF